MTDWRYLYEPESSIKNEYKKLNKWRKEHKSDKLYFQEKVPSTAEWITVTIALLFSICILYWSFIR